MAEETYDRSADPGDSGVRVRGTAAGPETTSAASGPGTDGLEDTDFTGDGELDASDTLEGDPGDDPLDTGVAPAGQVVGRETLRHHAGRGARG